MQSNESDMQLTQKFIRGASEINANLNPNPVIIRAN